MIATKFEIEGDNQAILKTLEVWKVVFDEQYKKNMASTKQKLELMGMAKTADAFSDKFDMFFWEEDGKVIIRIPMYLPRWVKWMKTEKKVGENFQKFLESQGIYVKSVKHIGD